MQDKMQNIKRDVQLSLDIILKSDYFLYTYDTYNSYYSASLDIISINPISGYLIKIHIA